MTKTEQARQELERELRAVKDNQDICKDKIHAMEQNLIHWEIREETILDQLAELDGNDLVAQEEIEEHTETIGKLFLDTNAQGDTIQ